MARIATWTLAATLVTGCSLDASGLPRGAPVPTFDSGPPVSTFDAGPGDVPCDPGQQRCEMGVAIRCSPMGQTLTENCVAMGLVCDASEGAPHCEAPPQTCEPNTTRCVGDELATCRADGSGEDLTTCPFGCELDRCRDAPPCEATDITLGVHLLNSCGRGNDDTPFDTLSDSCPDSPDANGEDFILRWEVTEARSYRIHLRNDEPAIGGFVDPVFSIRTSCDQPSSQFACNDDGLGYPNAGLIRSFPVGTYYIVIDSYTRNADACGRMRMLIEPF